MEDEKAQNDATVNESEEAKTDEKSIPAIDIPSIAVPKIEIISDIDDSKLTVDEPSIVSEAKAEDKDEKSEEKVESVAEEKSEEKAEPVLSDENVEKVEAEPVVEEKAEEKPEPKAQEKAEPELKAEKAEAPKEAKPEEKSAKADSSKHKVEAGENIFTKFFKSAKARAIGIIVAIVVVIVAITGILACSVGPLAKPAPMTIEQYVKSNKKAARDLADIATRNTNGFMTMRIVVKGDELQALYTFNKQANKDVLPTIKAAMRQAFNEPKAVKTFTTLPAGFPADKIRPSHVRVVLYNHDGKEILVKVYSTMK